MLPKKEGPHSISVRPHASVAWLGAQVASPRCPILRSGDATLSKKLLPVKFKLNVTAYPSKKGGVDIFMEVF